MAGFDVLDPLLAAPDRAGVLTDFDGTLSAVVDDPAAAAALPGTVEVLQRLTGRYAVVAVVSGRPTSFLVGRLGGGLRLSGLYGLEEVSGDDLVVAPAAAPWAPVVEGAAARARAELGPVVEPKGLSLTLHFRAAPDREGAIRRWAEAEAAGSGLVVRSAKASVELHPPVDADKGTVVEALGAGLDAVCFLGDDVGDLPAFDALDRLAERGVHAVRVAVRSAEAPAAMLERADLVVEGPEGALRVLTRLAGG